MLNITRQYERILDPRGSLRGDFRKPPKLGRLPMIAKRLGILNKWNVFWSWYDPTNFGDWISPYLYTRITGGVPIHCKPKFKPPTTTYLGAGSIMRHIARDGTAIVWGSGVIYRYDEFKAPKKIFAVRGPITRIRCLELGYDCPELFGDPGILLPHFYQSPSTPNFLLGIIPHFSDYEELINVFRGNPHVLVIDVRKPVEAVIDMISACELCISSSLHGIIVSHSYGKRCAWVKFSNNLTGDGTKFLDYYSSVGLNAECHDCSKSDVNDIARLIKVARHAPMPSSATLKSISDQLMHVCPFNNRF